MLGSRSVMSDAFDLKPEWNERLKSAIFSKILVDKYFLDIDKHYSKTGLISHIDLDIFANAVLLSKKQGIISQPQDIESRFEQLEEIVRRFRATTEAIKMLDSTTHAIIRAGVDVNQTDVVLKMLRNRLKFGLILDDYSNTFLLNKFIKTDNFRDASKVAVLMMLQEEFDVPVANHMAIYATYKYVKQMHVEGEENLPAWEPLPDVVEPEPEEEVKIRVREVENPYFDDHFDLTKKEHLLGKTLANFKPGLDKKILSNSTKLIGNSDCCNLSCWIIRYVGCLMIHSV